MATSKVQLKSLIAQGHFETITSFIVRSIVQRFFPHQAVKPVGKVTFSAILALIFGLLLSVGVAGNYLAGRVQVTRQVFSIFLLGMFYVFMLCIVNEFQKDEFMRRIKDDILDAMIKESDRRSLQQSLSTIFSIRRQFWAGVIFSLSAHLAFIAVDPTLFGKFGIGLLLVNIVFHTFHGFCVYFYLTFLEWILSNLKNYRLRLFELDPASSEIISKIATLLQSSVSLLTLMVAFATLIFSSTRVLPFASVAAMVFLMWANTITLYFINRHVLKTIIMRSKWESMVRIQEQIRELQSKDKIPQSETLKHIDQLQEHHDKIMRSPNSPWDFVRFINTLNTLIWPTLGVVATNIGDFLDLIKKVKEMVQPH